MRLPGCGVRCEGVRHRALTERRRATAGGIAACGRGSPGRPAPGGTGAGASPRRPRIGGTSPLPLSRRRCRASRRLLSFPVPCELRFPNLCMGTVWQVSQSGEYRKGDRRRGSRDVYSRSSRIFSAGMYLSSRRRSAAPSTVLSRDRSMLWMMSASLTCRARGFALARLTKSR